MLDSVSPMVQQMLQLAESIPQARLTQAADRLNRMLEGLSTEEVRSKLQTIDWLLEREVGRLALEAISRSDQRLISRVQRAGITNLIDDDEARSAVHLIEETSKLAGMISTMFEEKASGVQVVIGGDGRNVPPIRHSCWPNNSHLSHQIIPNAIARQDDRTMF